MTGFVRAYRTGDEDQIVELSNQSLAPYAGWMPRTVEYWRWSILTRPGADVLVLESDGRILGYTALLQDGNVLDFSVAADQRRRKRKTFIKQLIGALEDNARARGCELLTFSLPACDPLTDEALRKAGYVIEQGQYFSLGILDPLPLLRQLLSARGSRVRAAGLDTCTLELQPGSNPIMLASRLRIQLNPDIRVEDVSAAGDPPGECVIRLDLCALTELIFCRVPVDTLLQESRLEIAPPAGIAAARRLLDALVIDTPWHVPYCDGF